MATTCPQFLEPIKAVVAPYYTDRVSNQRPTCWGWISTYNYQYGELIRMVTPYGKTLFDTGEDDSERWVQVTDPAGGLVSRSRSQTPKNDTKKLDVALRS